MNPSVQEPNEISASYVCFYGTDKIADGSLASVAMAACHLASLHPNTATLTFDRRTGNVIDLNISGTKSDVASRYATLDERVAKRGRPKLGVVPREITLLPRHWEWLGQQPGGASVTLRKLVDAARKDTTSQEKNRECIAATYKFMFAVAGDFQLFEEASRALFAQNFVKFRTCVGNWPVDIRNELMLFLRGVMPSTENSPTPSSDVT